MNAVQKSGSEGGSEAGGCEPRGVGRHCEKPGPAIYSFTSSASGADICRSAEWKKK
jgi:hypothetical protein